MGDIGQKLLAAMRESDEWAMPADLLRSLGDQGLSVCTAAERKVLEAMSLVPTTWCEMAVGSSQITRGLAPLAAAELARRGGANG